MEKSSPIVVGSFFEMKFSCWIETIKTVVRIVKSYLWGIVNAVVLGVSNSIV